MQVKATTSVQAQEEHFAAFIKKLIEKFNPLQVYCFGKHMEFTHKEGSFTDEVTEQKCQYFLLMVTESMTRIENAAQDFANAHCQFGTVHILAHGKETILSSIHDNNRFFIHISRSAQLLYSQDGLLQPLASVAFIPTQAAVKATKHYTYRIQLATGFLESAKECQLKQRYQLSLFMLHQTVEQCCNALIKVYLAYRSDIHNLNRLLLLCNCFSPAPLKMFLSSPEDERLFNILVKSYSAARYNDNFQVEEADAEQLYTRVSVFVALTKLMCGQKIDALAKEAESYKKLKAEREVCQV
ncbi:HEPN domain-containing protein [Pedobacter sp. AW31-3R]|uniref:HEPN domain-containing protein n=1 Tax=Pedobacter sp. AW31-3R TaxID=3445781 RepID=UPI003FA04B49